MQHFSGDWGRALQLATVFLALLFLAVLMLSGSVRARLRVFIAKNFFAYRYDYRAEWLRFTARLSGDPINPASRHGRTPAKRFPGTARITE